MFYGRLQPQPATLAVRVLFLMGGVLGLAGMTGVCAGQTPAGRPPSTNRAAPKTSPPPPKVVNNPSPLGTSGKSARKAAGAESLKTATPRIPSTAGGRARQTPASRPLLTNQVKAQTSLPHSKVVHNPSPRGISGEPSREVRGVGAESLKPMCQGIHLSRLGVGILSRPG